MIKGQDSLTHRRTQPFIVKDVFPNTYYRYAIEELRSGICGKDTDLCFTVLIRNKDVDQVGNCINVVATRVIITRVAAD